MNTIVGKLANFQPDLANGGGAGNGQGAGKRPSPYDQAAARVKNASEGNASAAGLSRPAPTAISTANSPARLQPSARVTPAAQVMNGLAAARSHLSRLQNTGAVQGATEPQGLKGRLIGIEQQYAQLNSALQTMPSNATPQQWIVLQQQMYSMSENIGTLSKMVSQASSGMKSMLQTQV